MKSPFERGRGADKWKYFEQLDYSPHPRQREYHTSKARFKVAAAGRRFGKSSMAARDKGARLFEQRPDGSGTRGWIVAPSYGLADKEFGYMYDDIVRKLCAGMSGVKATQNVRTGDMRIVMPWGSFVEAKSAEYPKGLVGEGLDWIIVAEAAKLPKIIWTKYLRPALADRHGDADFVSTPEGMNWFHEFYKHGQDASMSDWESWNFTSWENPYVYPGGFDDPEITSMLETMDEDEFWQEIGADFRAVVGLIYGTYSDQTHLDDWVYDPALPNYAFVDFGFANKFCMLQAQVTPSEEVHVWDEYYVSGKSVHEHAEILLAGEHRIGGWPDGFKITAGFGDAADPSGLITLTKMLGAPFIGENDAKDWVAGRDLVRKFLKTHAYIDPDTEIITQRPKLFFDRTYTPNLQSEIERYRNKSTPAAVKGEANRPEKPHGLDDHALDALRYGIVHLFGVGIADSLAGIDFSRKNGLFVPKRAPPVAPSEIDLFSIPSKSVFTLNRQF